MLWCIALTSYGVVRFHAAPFLAYVALFVGNDCIINTLLIILVYSVQIIGFELLMRYSTVFSKHRRRIFFSIKKKDFNAENLGRSVLFTFQHSLRNEYLQIQMKFRPYFQSFQPFQSSGTEFSVIFRMDILWTY